MQCYAGAATACYDVAHVQIEQHRSKYSDYSALLPSHFCKLSLTSDITFIP
jgi:hypothetical protein